MLTTSITAVASAAIVLGAASASQAQGRGGPPKINIQKTCNENIAALQTLLGNDIQQTAEICLQDEQMARDQLVKDWANYPALAKSRCIQPQEYLPGYIEWLTCLEMTRDTLQMLKERESGSSTAQTAPGQSSKRRGGRAASDCPVVKYNERNADIDYVINCPGIAMPGIR
jgi:hypothetical protein